MTGTGEVHISATSFGLTGVAIDRRTAGVERRLDQLDRIFRKRGFLDLGMAEFAAELKCSKRALYEIAPGKRALIERVLQRRFAQIRQQGWDAAARHDSAPDRLWAYLEVGTSALVEMGDIWLADMERDERAAHIFNAHQQLRADGIREIVEEGITSGHFAGYHPRLVAEVVSISFRRMRDPAFLREAGMTLAQSWNELTQLIQNGLYPRNQGGKTR